MMSNASPARLGAATVQELREDVRGDVVDPADPAYDQARAVWNGDVDRHPSLVVRPSGAADVITALRFARSEGWKSPCGEEVTTSPASAPPTADS